MLLASACVRSNGRREVVNWEDRLRALAGFQFACDSEALQIIDLEHGWRAGVTGCGKRGTYRFDQGLGQWISEEMSPTAQEQPAAPPPLEFTPRKVE